MSEQLRLAYQELERNRQLEDEREDERKKNLSQFYQEVLTPKDTTTPVGFSQLAKLDNEVKQATTPTPFQTSGKKSLTQLSEDPEFAVRAERFLDGIGSNENIFEYLRDSDYSLSSAIVRSFQTGKWTEEQKQDYNYLKEQFNNAELRGFKEKFGLVKDLAGDILLDPLNAVAALFAIPTAGTSVALAGGLSTATKVSAKALAKAKLKQAKGTALLGASEGAAWGGLHNYFMQDMDVDLGLDTEVDLRESALSGLIGGAFGGAIGGAAGMIPGGIPSGFYSKTAKKELNYANENDIVVTPETRAKEANDYELQEIIGTSKDKIDKRFLTFISQSIGKPTTEFLKAAEKSPALQNFLRKLRYDYDAGVLKSRKEGVNKVELADGTETTQTFGEALSRRFGNAHFKLAKALNVLYRTGFRAKIIKEQNDVLKTLLRDKDMSVNKIDNFIGNQYKGFDIDVDVASAYKGVRTLLDDTYKDASGLGLFQPGTINVGGYFPRLFRYEVLLKKREKFEDILVRSGHADPINEKTAIKVKDLEGNEIFVNRLGDEGIDNDVFGVNFADEASNGRTSNIEELTAEELTRAKKLKANAIVENMLEERWTPIELRQKGRAQSSYLTPRRFTKIADDEIDEFLEDDVQNVLENYFTNISQSIERKRYFGGSLNAFSKERNKIRNELIDAGISVEDAGKIGQRLDDVFKKVTGLETYSQSFLKRNKYGRVFNDWGKLTQQMAYLPFATLSSVTEPLLLLTRVGTADAPAAVANIGRALVKEGSNVFDRTFKGIQRGVFGKKVKGFKDLDDETWNELYSTGLALEQAVQERIEGLAGEALTGSIAKAGQQAFFKLNLLTQWTKAVQLASFTTGKRLIKQNARKLSEGNLSSRQQKYLTGQLNELGIEADDAVNWYRSSLNEAGQYDDNLARGLDGNLNIVNDSQASFYSRDFLNGANRFTKEIILNPSVAEANRPLWFSSPAAQLLVQFAGYPTVFNNTILKRFANETKTYPIQVGIAKVLPTTLLMTAVAYVGNEIRSNGKATLDYSTGAPKPEGEIILDAMRRWGGFGPFDYVNRYTQERERNVGDLTSILKALVGPLPQQGLDAVLYRKNFAELGVTNLPLYGAYDLMFGEGTKKKLRSLARGKKEKETKFKPLRQYAKGGIVMNVPNVKNEPDEMQSRVTGIPFNATSEAAQDVEDRALRGQLEGLGLREPLFIGGLVDRVRDYLDMTDVDARRIEQEAAEMVNQLVDEGLISEDQRQELGPESKGGIRYLKGGKTPATNAITHQLYASKVGDSKLFKQALQRTALFAREKIQAFEKPEDSALDELNNQIGFAIYEEAEGDPDKIRELIRQKAIEQYKVD